MKRVVALLMVFSIVFVLCACGHQHTWIEATCTEPKTCSECGAVEGEALGHEWVEATCVKAKTCSKCGETEGDPLGHKANPATCTEDSVCSVCGQIVSKATGHQANPATCTEDAVCSVCGEIVEKATGHDWVKATAGKPKTCKICGITEGKPLGYKYFSKDSHEFIKAYNKSKHALGKLDKDNNTMKITGTNLKIIFFVDDVSEVKEPGVAHVTYAIPKQDFNEMIVRYISYGSRNYDTDSLSVITLIGQSFAEVFDPTFDGTDFVRNGSNSSFGNNITLTYSHKGFEYTLKGYPSIVGSSSNYFYDFTISLSANKE